MLVPVTLPGSAGLREQRVLALRSGLRAALGEEVEIRLRRLGLHQWAFDQVWDDEGPAVAAVVSAVEVVLEGALREWVDCFYKLRPSKKPDR